KDAFYIEQTALTPAPDNTIFENMRITHSAGAGPATGSGILFDLNNVTSTGVIAGCLVRNVSIDSFVSGINMINNPGLGTLRGRLSSLTLQQCAFHDNSSDGVYLQEFSNLKIIGCEFVSNGRFGLFLHPYVTLTGGTSGAAVGTAFVQSCVMKSNV